MLLLYLLLLCDNLYIYQTLKQTGSSLANYQPSNGRTKFIFSGSQSPLVATACRCTHREHVSNDAAVELENVPLVQPVIGHVCVVDKTQLHEGSDEELVDVTGHGLCLVLLTQHLINLGRHRQGAAWEKDPNTGRSGITGILSNLVTIFQMFVESILDFC